VQHLYQLLHPDLPEGFPLLGSLSRRSAAGTPEGIRLLLVDDEARLLAHVPHRTRDGLRANGRPMEKL